MKPVKFTLNGEEHSLLIDLNTISDFEEEFDANIIDMLKNKKISISMLRGLFWAGMLHENENLKVREVGTMISQSVANGEHDFSSLADKLKKAVDDSDLFKMKGAQKPKNAKNPKG
jgi:predicted RNA-binding protein with RPS1 domain